MIKKGVGTGRGFYNSNNRNYPRPNMPRPGFPHPLYPNGKKPVNKPAPGGISKSTKNLMFIVIGVFLIVLLFIIIRSLGNSPSDTDINETPLESFTSDMKISNVEVLNYTNMNVQVDEGYESGDVASIDLVVYGEDGSVISRRNIAISELEDNNFQISLKIINTSRVKEVSMTPIFLSSSGERVTGQDKEDYAVPDEARFAYIEGDNVVLGNNSAAACINDSQCNDNNDCTTDTCTESGNCTYTPIEGCASCSSYLQCDDNNNCTANLCSNEKCSYPAIPGCVACSSALQCDDNDSCTNNLCITGRCMYSKIVGCKICNSNEECFDDNPCTNDTCTSDGICKNPSLSNCITCTSNSQCNDNDVSTNESCINNKCQYSNINACKNNDMYCPEGCDFTNDNDCQFHSVCGNGIIEGDEKCDSSNLGGATCAGFYGDAKYAGTLGCYPITCNFDTSACIPPCVCNDDNNPCTFDTCSSGVCQHTPLSGISCNDDKNPCTSDVCSSGVCKHKPLTGYACPDDGKISTSDICSSVGVCEHNLITSCISGDGYCPSVCSYANDHDCKQCTSASQCDDENKCTNDDCSSSGLCTHSSIYGCCISSSQCASGQYCVNNQCIDGPNPSCNNLCTLNARVCLGTTGYQTCITGSNGCTVWSSSVTICSRGKVCSNGACISGDTDPGTTCTNECSSYGLTQCSGTSLYQTCGNYDSDSCLEWGALAACPSPQTCNNGVCSGGDVNPPSTPTCYDGIQNQGEAGVDCGGPCTTACNPVTPPSTTGTTYYVSNSGSDSNSGTDRSHPLQTISKVNTLSLKPGDVVLFERGGTWRETLTVSSSGNSANYISFGNYGTGAKPKIYGSEVATSWVNQGNNIWKSSNTFTNPFVYSGYESEIFFENKDGTISWGTHKTTSTLTAEYQWAWSSNYIYVYSTSDPSTKYASVEIPQRKNCINIGESTQYVLFDGFDLKYAMVFIVYDNDPSSVVSGFTLRNSELAYVGSRDKHSGYCLSVERSNYLVQNNDIHDGGRRIISYHLYDVSGITLSGIIIENNSLHDGYHGSGYGISMDDGRSGNTFQNIIIRNNLIYDSPDRNILVDGWDPTTQGHMEVSESGGTIKNVQIYNNIFKYPSYMGVELFNVNTASVYNNVFYDVCHNPNGFGYVEQLWITHNSKAVVVKNNIFYSAASKSIAGPNGIYVESGSTSEITVDNNLFYAVDPNAHLISIYSTGKDYIASTWNQMKTDLGWQAHDPGIADPLFVDPANNDFHLQPGSPAIGKGVNVGITTDRAGKPYNNPPSIGAYEY